MTQRLPRLADLRARRSRPGVVVALTGAVVVLLVIAGYMAVPPVRQMANQAFGGIVEDARRRFSPRYALLDERSVMASSSENEHAVELAFDGRTNTYWSTTETQPAITVELPAVVDVGAIIIHPGVPRQESDFRTPSDLQVTSLDTGATVTLRVPAGLERQDLLVDLPSTRRLEIRVLASRGGDSLQLAISEIEINARE